MSTKSDKHEAASATPEAEALTAIDAFIAEANGDVLHAGAWKCVCGHTQSLDYARRQHFSEIAARNWLHGTMKNHCKGGAHIQAKRLLEPARGASLHRYFGSGGAASGAAAADSSILPNIISKAVPPGPGNLAVSPLSAQPEAPGPEEPPASHPPAGLVDEMEQNAVPDPRLSASEEIVGVSHQVACRSFKY